MPKFRKKPIVIEAVQWIGTKTSWDAIMNMGVREKHWIPGEIGSDTFYLPTLGGPILVGKNDFVIKGAVGEFYPCKPDIFEKTYEPVE